MKITPCLKTKLLIPELPHQILYSDRIKGLPLADQRAVIITAPGGYGKTTSVLLALDQHREQVSWYRMEKEDQFLPVFYTHLIETLFRIEDKSSLDCHRGLSSISHIDEEYPLLNALLCQDAWQFFANQKTRHYIVLDDYQNVLANPRISESIDYFISNMPPTISMLILSREETGIFPKILPNSQKIARINTDQMRFTNEESEEFLLNVCSNNLSRSEMNQIVALSEGWIAGLSIICHAKNPSSFFSNTPAVSENNTEQNLFSHFFNKYLREIDTVRLEQLANAATLHEFTTDALQEILDIESPCEFVLWLENSNLYIQKTMTYPVRYRFHSLFRKELRTYLTKTKSTSYIKNLYAKAASYFYQMGEFQTAIRFYILSGQMAEAISVLSTIGAELFAQGKPEEVMYMTTEFPDKVVETNSYLLFYKGLLLLTSDIDLAYTCFRTALLMFKDENDLSYLMNAYGMILVLSFQTNDFKFVTEVTPYIPKLKIALGPSVPRRKLLNSGFIGVVANEKLRLGSLLCKLIKKLNVSEPVWVYSFLIIRGMMFYRTGKLKAANEGLPAILSHPVGLASDHWRATGLIACHNTLWLQREVDASKKIMEEFAELGEKYNSDLYRSFSLRLSAILNYQTRDISGAIADMDEVANCYARYGSTVLANAALITKYLWETELKPAKTLIKQAESSFLSIPPDNAGHGYHELCQAMMGAIFKAAGDYEKAESYLLSAYRTSQKKSARQHLCAAAMHLADLYERKKNPKLFEKFLLIWAKKSSQAGYVYFHEMDYNTLVRVCALAMEKELFSAHMMKMIGTYFGLEAAKSMSENPSVACSDSQKFLDHFSGTTKAKAIIRVTLLGTFSIQKDDILIQEKSWKTRKVSGILKYILANPDKSVTRELLSSVFWPDSDAKAASTSLRVALYELRKNLTSRGMGFADEHALIKEDHGGFHVGSRVIVETDTEEFNRLYDLYKFRSLSDEAPLKTLEKMVELYTGDFLEGCSYGDWNLMQEHYKSKYIEVSQTLSAIKIKRGDLKEAEALLEKHMNLDPYDEKGCALLVKTYEATGQKARATSFARQFRKKFSAEIGVSPDLEFPGS